MRVGSSTRITLCRRMWCHPILHICTRCSARCMKVEETFHKKNLPIPADNNRRRRGDRWAEGRPATLQQQQQQKMPLRSVAAKGRSVGPRHWTKPYANMFAFGQGDDKLRIGRHHRHSTTARETMFLFYRYGIVAEDNIVTAIFTMHRWAKKCVGMLTECLSPNGRAQCNDQRFRDSLQSNPRR